MFRPEKQILGSFSNQDWQDQSPLEPISERDSSNQNNVFPKHQRLSKLKIEPENEPSLSNVQGEDSKEEEKK